MLQRNKLPHLPLARAGAVALALALVGACNGGEVGPGAVAGDPKPRPDAGSPGGPGSPDAAVVDTSQLAQRRVDLGLALRTAAIKLLGDLPTLAEQASIQRDPDPRGAYEKRIDAWLADPRFAARLVAYHRNTFKMGGPADGDHASRETAPAFAAMVVASDRPYTDIFTATSGTCPTFDAGSGTFKPADCKNGVPAGMTAGVLTDPGVASQFVSNLAFRRVRWVQETFACRRFPAEYSKSPMPMGAGTYTSPWPFTSIAGGKTASVDFHDTSSVICANCHSTMNHIAPLFAHFDPKGMWTTDIAVTTPLAGLPKAKLADWLPAGEPTAWRFGVEVSSLPALGAALAVDPEVERCTLARAYGFAMAKGDLVVDQVEIPPELLAPLRTAYLAKDHSFKAALRAAFTSDDFVKF